MIKLLYVISSLMLIGAGIVLVRCGRQWSRDMSRDESNSEASIAERFRMLGSIKSKSSQDIVSPIVKEATAYALYLTPPAPKARKVAAQPTNSVQSVHKPVGAAPRFRLLSTTYYRSNPDRSLALVSEPGKGDHWIKKDERLGHFVVESVEKGSIVYRDGNRLHEVKVPTKETVQIAKTEPAVLVSSPAMKPDLRLLNASQSTEVE